MKDEKNFPSPQDFNPEMHLRDAKTCLSQAKEDPSDLVFGFGRRCITRDFRRSTATDFTTISESVPVGISRMQPFG